MKVILSKMFEAVDADVENNFRAAVDDTRRWAAIMGTIPLLFLVEEEEGLLEEVVSRSIVKSPQPLSWCR